MLLYVLRLGLPLGSSLVAATLFDTIFGFFWVLLHYCSYINAVFQDPQPVVEKGYYLNLQWSFFISLRAMLAILLWVGVIFMGKRRALIFWLISSIIDDLGILGNIVYDQLQYQQKFSTEVYWILNVIIFVIFRFYITSISIQVLWYLGKDFDNSEDSFPMNENDSIQPVGQGFLQFWDYYKDFPSGGANILLTTEILWNTFTLLTSGLVKVLFDNELFIAPSGNAEAYIALEETIIRCIRIFFAVLALIFIRKVKPTLMRIWICAYFIMSIASLGIFFMFIRIWETPDFFRIFFYSIYIPMDNFFRGLIIYYSIKFSITYRRTIAPDSYYL